MATQISGVAFSSLRQLAPPFIDGNGNIYFVGVYASDTSALAMMKSSDGGDTWAEVDSGNRPDGSVIIYCVDAFQDDDVIHIAAQTSGGALTYSSFNTSDNASADVWVSRLDSITNCALAGGATGCSIVVRSNGDIIVFYNGDADDGDAAVYYAKYTDSWSVDSVIVGGTFNYHIHGAVLGEDDKVYFVFSRDDWVIYRSLNSEDTLSGWTYVFGEVVQKSFRGAKPVYYDDDGVERITHAIVDSSYVGRSVEWDDGGASHSGLEVTDGGEVAHQNVTGPYGASFMFYVAVDAGIKTVYYLWSDADEGDDIYYSKCVDSGAWSAPVELNDGVTVDERGGIVANFYTNGSNIVVAYVYNDNGNIYYDELTVRKAPVEPSVSDNVDTSESTECAGGVNPSVNDSTSLSEYYRAVPPPLIPSVSDSVSISSEFVDIEPVFPVYASVSDSVVASESVDAGNIPNPDISDSVPVTENVEFAGGVNPDVNDGISVTENIVASVLPIDVNVSDSISITEYVKEWSHIPIPAIGDENIHASENVAVDVYNPAFTKRHTGIAATYNVRLKNHNGVVTAIFDNFLRLEYELRVNDVGYFSLTFADDNDVRFSQFFVDAQVEIWRSVPGQSVDFYKVFEGFFRKLNKTTAETGERLITFSGVGYNDLLARTIIAYKAGTIRADKDAPVETVMKEYVEENCGITADDTVVGRLYQGYLPDFSVEPTAGGGPNWEGSRAFENLLDVLSDIGQQTAVDFEVVGSGPARFEFKTYVDQIGEDRRGIDLDSRGRNPAGNRPVIFSIEFGYASDFSYTYDRMGEGNVVVILGEGEGSTQTTITRSNEDAVIASPWNRCEVSRPGTSQEYEYQLNQLGDEVLEELKAQQFMEFTPLQQASQMYGVHYGIGDRITVKSDDIKTHSKIVVVRVMLEQDAEQVELEFSDIPVRPVPPVSGVIVRVRTGYNVYDDVFVSESVSVSI